MDIFVRDIPPDATHTELRSFLKSKLEGFDILAFDVTKFVGKRWAIVSVASEVRGEKFLAYFGSRRRGPPPRMPLIFRGASMLHCERSVGGGKSDGLKFEALFQKEQQMRDRAGREGAPSKALGPPKPTYSFAVFTAGVWEYDKSGQMVFQEKYHDLRPGTITFGNSALAVYLKAAPGQSTWSEHCRIDIPYGTIEHTIPSIGREVAIYFTLSCPPKFFSLPNTGDLHRYSAEHPSSTTGLAQNIDGNIPLELSNALQALALSTLNTNRSASQMSRICSVNPGFNQTSALCMVYRVAFNGLQTARNAWNFVKNTSALPQEQQWKKSVPSVPSTRIEDEYSILEAQLASWSSVTPDEFDFGIRFQLFALVLEGTITPLRMLQLVPLIREISTRFGRTYTALGIRKLASQIPTPSPTEDAEKFNLASIIGMIENNIEAVKARESFEGVKGGSKSYLTWTYKAVITPTGMLLRGPDPGVTNRVLRKYSDHSEHFLRVEFVDEDGVSVLYDPRASQANVYERFREVLQKGIVIAGQRYEFLGFSHSSLRCHAVWFMAAFYHDGRIVHAKQIIEDLGDFTHIQCGAKCAARIGQAFSDTMLAVPLPKAFIVENHMDIHRNGRCFSDGCGTISPLLLNRIWKALPRERRKCEPTVLQIRYRGAKGVVSLDSSLPGEQLLIRGSMTKFDAKENPRILEICGAAYNHLPAYLNHQFIKILEDLGVPERNFLSLQEDAINELEKVSRHPLTAAKFLENTRSGIAAQVPKLFQLLHMIGIDPRADRFLTDIVEVALMTKLRDLKYRARIPIEKGCVLYGIMDETNTLKENEVYIPLRIEDDRGRVTRGVLVRDRVIVTRAPALHPGDVQVAKAVDVPEDSHLQSLHNCIVFSQQGSRDLPSKLGGGDLDGDLFQIFYDEKLLPRKTVLPADYPPVAAKNLDRSVQVEDIVDFFVEFMQSDRLGQISVKHKIRADRFTTGTMDQQCILLAELASNAVDFSKSGVPVDMKKIPPGADHIRPDFMASGPGLVLNALGAAELREIQEDDIDDPDGIGHLDPDKNRIRYVQSQRVLGKLYRNPKLNEVNFFARLKNDFEETRNSMGKDSVMKKLKQYIDKATVGFQWDHHQEFAVGIREYYEENMFEIMDSLRTHRGEPLTELEVFSGNIMGKKERAQTHHLKEANREVRDRFDRDVREMISRIKHGDGDWEDKEGEALPRAIACFNVALETEGWDWHVELKSWKYVTAAVCLDLLFEQWTEWL